MSKWMREHQSITMTMKHVQTTCRKTQPTASADTLSSTYPPLCCLVSRQRETIHSCPHPFPASPHPLGPHQHRLPRLTPSQYTPMLSFAILTITSLNTRQPLACAIIVVLLAQFHAHSTYMLISLVDFFKLHYNDKQNNKLCGGSLSFRRNPW